MATLEAEENGGHSNGSHRYTAENHVNEDEDLEPFMAMLLVMITISFITGKLIFGELYKNQQCTK